MMIIHRLLTEGRVPNRSNLSKQLGVSRKTVERDIAFMRDQLHLPIEYDPQKFGFFYTQRVTQFPNMQMSEREVASLHLLHRLSTARAAGPLKDLTESALRKISTDLHQAGGTCVSTQIQDAFYFSSHGKPRIEDGLFNLLSQATWESVEISFLYKKLGGHGYEKRTVQPYHLSEVSGQWYLLAFDHLRQGMRVFVLARMKDLEVSDTHFEKKSEYSAEKLLKDSFGIVMDSGRYEVKLRFDRVGAMLAMEREWHPSQKMKQFPNGELEMRMTLGSLTEVRVWVLSFGRHCRVITPKELIGRLREDARALAKFYLE